MIAQISVSGRAARSAVWIFAIALLASASPAQERFVVHVSVDGLRPDAIGALGAAGAPNFHRLMNEGAHTLNARTDYAWTVTLPNHVTHVTGRRVNGTGGHNWVSNSDPPPGLTIHLNKGSYVASVWDVAHDHGLRTACYASKSKFVLFEWSYDAAHGAPDVTGADNGRDKIDSYLNDEDTPVLMAQFITDMADDPFHYAFIHLRDPDDAGHAAGWNVTPGSVYSNAIRDMDDRLGDLFELVEGHALLAGNTWLIVTSDHGGAGTNHSDATLPQNYTIPFFVWGPGVACGEELYSLNPVARADPGTSRPTYGASVQPLRNGEAANVALALLGLPEVPLSQIDYPHSLNTAPLAATGDTNCDGTVNPFDIAGFILALDGSGAYGAAHPCCNWMSADVNGDGSVNPFDIVQFVDLLTP